jgi:hypothetical protein
VRGVCRFFAIYFFTRDDSNGACDLKSSNLIKPAWTVFHLARQVFPGLRSKRSVIFGIFWLIWGCSRTDPFFSGKTPAAKKALVAFVGRRAVVDMRTTGVRSSLPQGDDMASLPDVSLIRGGPFYQAQRATRLIAPDHWNLGRRIAFAVAIGWLPLVVITAISKPSAMGDLLRDYRVTARMLVAVPVLLMGQTVMESRFRMIVRHLRELDLLRPHEVVRLNAIIERLLRLRDSLWPELVMIALVYANVGFASSSASMRSVRGRSAAKACSIFCRRAGITLWSASSSTSFLLPSAPGSGSCGLISRCDCPVSKWI